MGDITGEKVLIGNFSDLISAQNQASIDEISHYSVEQLSNNGIDYSIIFIC